MHACCWGGACELLALTTLRCAWVGHNGGNGPNLSPDITPACLACDVHAYRKRHPNLKRSGRVPSAGFEPRLPAALVVCAAISSRGAAVENLLSRTKNYQYLLMLGRHAIACLQAITLLT